MEKSEAMNVNYFEIFVLFLNCFIALVFNNYKNGLIAIIEDLIIKYKFSDKYLNSFLHSIKKSYLSINLSKFSINSNGAFKDFLKKSGINEDKINWILERNLQNEELEEDKNKVIKQKMTNNRFNLNNKKSIVNNSNDIKNFNTSDRI